MRLDVEVLNACRLTKFADDGIQATRLFPRRFSCDEINNRELKKLDGESMHYAAADTANPPMYRLGFRHSRNIQTVSFSLLHVTVACKFTNNKGVLTTLLPLIFGPL